MPKPITPANFWKLDGGGRLGHFGLTGMQDWLGKQILGQTDEVRHEVSGSVATYLSVIMPRSVEAPSAAPTGVARRLIETDEAEANVEIQSADYETVLE